MKKGDWIFEQYDIDGTEINILMEILQVKNDEIEIRWCDTKMEWPEHNEMVARDEIERYINMGELVIINDAEAVKYLLAGAK